MKVAYITSTVSPDSGIGNFSYHLIRSLQSLVIATVIVSTKEQLTHFESHKILPDPATMNPKNLVGSVTQIIKLIKGCDIVHCLDERYLAPAGIAAFLTRKSLVVHSIGTYSIALCSKSALKYLYRLLFKHAYSVICISNFTQKVLQQYVKPCNSAVIFPGVAEEYFESVEALQTTSGKAPKKILSVGAVKGRKGYDISLSAFARVRKNIHNLTYHIVGEIQSANYYAMLNRIVKEEKMENDVAFLGKVGWTDLIGWYRDCDIFLLTPRYIDDNFEGFGLVFLEAGASGKPVIASASGGISDAVMDRNTGILVPENDVDATSHALEELLCNNELRQTLSVNGYARAKEFSWDRTAIQIVQIYEKK
jgi:phosphatidyl-myo-inositol dimannoside synthase